MKTYIVAMCKRYQRRPSKRVPHMGWVKSLKRCGLTSLLLSLTTVIWGCMTSPHVPMKQAYEHEKPTCERIITADVVALEQVYYYNRFGSFNPAGIMYALRRDVVLQDEVLQDSKDRIEIINEDLDALSNDHEIHIPLKPQAGQDVMIVKDKKGDEKKVALAGHVKLRSDKRPRPLVLRANEGDCLRVTFTNLLAPTAGGQEVMNDPEFRLTHPDRVIGNESDETKGAKHKNDTGSNSGNVGKELIRDVIDGEEPATRHASMHVNGLSLVDSIDSQGVNVGMNPSSLAAPGETRVYTWYAKKEGTYFFYSMGAPAGGEGDGGQLGLGLFGSVNVQPKDAKWYRSQVTHEDLTEATVKLTRYGQPKIDYEKLFEKGNYKGDPILNMLKETRPRNEREVPVGKGRTAPCAKEEYQYEHEEDPVSHLVRWTCVAPAVYEIVHSDLNAVIDIEREDDCDQQGEGHACGKPYREFTVIFHDEVTAVQAFKELDEENSPLSSLRDGMGINYGASGVGPMVVANRKQIGPARDCVECKLEEFFLTSWVNGDPAMVVGYRRDKETGNLVPQCRKNKDGTEKNCQEKGSDHQTAPVILPDGTIFKRLDDESIEKIFPNGTRTKARPEEITFEFPYLYKKEAKYPDDPSNVHHSYLGDPVRFRNMHAGPKETHVFHLHAHQWVEDKHDALSHYLDSQTISPGSTFSYEVHYGGSGNRNLGPGDSIFHCHLYPHFAQGMWELWRTHDVFEDGFSGAKDKNGKFKGGVFDPNKPISETNNPRWRNLPDAEIEEGTPNPAIVPLPRAPLPPVPMVVKQTAKDGKEINEEDASKSFRGYPFYIAAQKGHRPPQPPLDLDGKQDKETLQRHVIVGDKGISKDGINADEPAHVVKDSKGGPAPIPPRQTSSGKPLLYEDGKNLSDYTARRVYRDNQNPDFFGLARQLTIADIRSLPETGTKQENAAMQFHAGILHLEKHHTDKGHPESHDELIKPGNLGWTHTAYNWDAPGYSSCLPDGTCDDEKGTRVFFRVNGGGNVGHEPATGTSRLGDGATGAPFSNPCPKHYIDEFGRVSPVMTREYRAVYIQMDMTINKAGWHDPQARFPVLEEDVKATLNGSRPTEPLFFRANSGECIVFKATNLIPSNLNLDDFQVYSPTDVIGQHIHLVKFDVTSSDGSGNGWNYEDGTLAADEVRERIIANNAFVKLCKERPESPICPTDPKVKKELSLLKPKTHPIFLKKGELGAKEDGALAGDTRGQCSDITNKEADDRDPIGHPWCGAQTTIQRWWADPVLNGKPGGKSDQRDVKDRTLRTVFTHDHFGPSSHQHHGFYAALVVEPRNSKWSFLDGRDMGGADEKGNPLRVINPETGKEHQDGGPTSYAANIIVRDGGKACLNAKSMECSPHLDNKNSIDRLRTGREFNLAFADFAIVYTSDMKNEDEPEGNRFRPVNPPNHIEGGVLNPEIPGRIPSPEGISTKDPGTQLINYRNEPIPLRIGDWSKPKESSKKDGLVSPWSCLPVMGDVSKKSCFEQKLGDEGDMAHVFSSKLHDYQGYKGTSLFTECLLGVCPKDRENEDLKKRTENEKKIADNEKNRIGRQKGDPATPLLQAYDGDRVQIRLIQGAQEEQHVFIMHGARWLAQPDSQNSGYVNAQHIGISEHFEFNDRMLGLSNLPSGVLGHGIEAIKCQKPGEQPCRTDLLLSSAAMDNLWDGQWGLMRIYPAEENNLNLNRIIARLPGNTDKNPFTDALSAPGLDERLDSEAEPPVVKTEKRFVHDPVEAFCKDPTRKEFLQTFSVEARMAKDLLGEKGLVYNKAFGITDPYAILFVEQKNVSAIQSGNRRLEPLILRARAGDCIEVTLVNKLPKEMPDDHRFLMDANPLDDLKFQRWQKTWSYNMLPPIIEGFNFNQVRSSNRVGLHAGLLDQNTRRHDGAHVGFNEDSTIEPNDSKTYLWYAGDLTGRKGGIRERPIEFGVIPLTDQADVIKHPAHGAIGALVIEPQCSEFRVEKVKDKDGEKESSAVATVTWWEPEREGSRDGKYGKAPRCPAKKPNERTKMSTFQKKLDTVLTPGSWTKTDDERFEGVNRFKEFVLLYQDALALQQHGQPMPNLRNGDDAEDSGQKAFNYRTEPLWARLGASAADEPDVMSEYDWSNVLSSRVVHEGCSTPPCDPETPIFEVDAGEPVRFRVVHPGGHPRQHALAIFGHNWSLNPWAYRSSVMGWNEDSPTRFGATNGIGPGRHLNIQTRAGGDCAVKGDYLYRTQEGFMFGGGLWGILRVNKPEDPGWWRPGIHPQNLVKQDDNACKVVLPDANK